MDSGTPVTQQSHAAAGPATPGYAWVGDAIRGGAEIVTANRRLSRELRNAFDGQQILAGKKSWHTPRIVPWSVWLHSLLDSMSGAVAVPLRLDGQASAIIWERLLADAAGERFLNTGGLVRQVRQTWQRLQDWRVPDEALQRSAGSDDERLFAAAAQQYRNELGANFWIDDALLAPFVAQCLSEGDAALPDGIVLAGFDRLTPAAEEIVRALQHRGCAVDMAPLPAHRRTPEIVSSPDGDAELRAAGAWARQRLLVNERARVAIVYPALEQNAARAARLVREGFAPGWQSGGRGHEKSVNVSYGQRLADYPLIAIALLWLQWLHRGLSSREVSVLMRTPFAGGGVTDGCSRLELALRRFPDRNWTAASLAGALRGRDESADALAWLARVEAIAACRANATRADSPAAWAARIDRLLEQLNLPGERQLDSLEFQLVNRWRELLNEFSRIDVVRPRLKCAEAVHRLSALAVDTVYQPETTTGMVQLLGTLEASGLEFDHVWIGNLHSLQWPPPAHALPLVSRALQRTAGMPDATPADTLEFSRRTFERLMASAPSVVLSWPEADREAELAPSPLLEPYVSRPRADHADPAWYAASFCAQDALESGMEDAAPAVLADEKIRGGAYTVQRQITDPLSAFAYGRLGLGDLQTIETGLSAQTRGSIIHAVLHRLLESTPSSVDIGKWTGSELQQLIDRSVDRVLARHERHADGVLHRLLALERARLRSMMRDFLAEETRRPPFAIESVESKLQLFMHGVVLDLRADRIDRLEDGSLLIIDYKTGAGKNLLNREGNPADMQLVVYACAIDGPVGGLALVNVDSRGIQYRGTGSSVPWKAIEPEQWDARLQAWKDLVSAAVARFAEGDVQVNIALPLDRTRPLSILSRIAELKK